jgi:hypothetical protein
MRRYELFQHLDGSQQRINGDAYWVMHPQESITEKPPITAQHDGAGDNAEEHQS